MVKRVILLSGDFTENMELFAPLHALQMLGIEVSTVCPGKKKGEKVSTAVHDFEQWQTYTEKQGHQLTLNASWEEVFQTYKEYDGLWIPGGRAPEYLRMNPEVLEVANYFKESGKPLAAICHGPQILVACGGLQGRKLTAYPAQEIEVKLAGAEWVKTDFDQAIVDGNIVTGPAWSANPAVLKHFIELLGVKICF
ncbi:hypothetical protein FGO68_gene935 [Halteria grandinella]|uniref:DJ-1/PfpI domain-containing protein n=1 Tax=Halteria grandinella TaxID=5974 RepID=A0A8J8SYL1_HALGN|nr:hypothetical protein FGO68_gene935 [Halteria grandinella]